MPSNFFVTRLPLTTTDYARPHCVGQAKPMRIAANGLIRLSIEELLSTPITHLVSGVDVDDSPKLSTCGKATSISGYTEWVSTSDPIISIGWDCPAAMSC